MAAQVALGIAPKRIWQSPTLQKQQRRWLREEWPRPRLLTWLPRSRSLPDAVEQHAKVLGVAPEGRCCSSAKRAESALCLKTAVGAGGVVVGGGGGGTEEAWRHWLR